MKNLNSVVALAATAVVFASLGVAIAQDANPAKEKFQQDLKDAVMSESITIAQVKDIQANLETVKAAKGAQQPGAPVDLMTPYTAVSQIRTAMAAVKEPAQTKLRQDFQLMMAAKSADQASEPETPGKKLGKDVFTAVLRGEPTPAQVRTLQESLTLLTELKTSNEGGLQKLRTLKKAKTDIEQTMRSGNFRPEDSQAVLDDLNNLGAGGRNRRGV